MNKYILAILLISGSINAAHVTHGDVELDGMVTENVQGTAYTVMDSSGNDITLPVDGTIIQGTVYQNNNSSNPNE